MGTPAESPWPLPTWAVGDHQLCLKLGIIRGRPGGETLHWGVGRKPVSGDLWTRIPPLPSTATVAAAEAGPDPTCKSVCFCL